MIGPGYDKKMPHFDHFTRPWEIDPYETLFGSLQKQENGVAH